MSTVEVVAAVGDPIVGDPIYFLISFGNSVLLPPANELSRVDINSNSTHSQKLNKFTWLVPRRAAAI